MACASCAAVRDQHLTDAALVQFTSRFGELETAPLFQGRRFVEEHPEVMIISNVTIDGREIGSLGNYEAFWHTDLNFVDEPPAASCLYAHEVPAEGATPASPTWKRRSQRCRLSSPPTSPAVAFSTTRVSTAPDICAKCACRTHCTRSCARIRDRPQSAVSRTPGERVDRRACRGRVRRIARCAMGSRDLRPVHLAPSLACRRFANLGQSLHAAPARFLESSARRIMHRTQTRGTRPF